MESVVIVGAGQAGIETACSLRERGFGGTIPVIGEEPGVPYQRPPLSKDLKADGELPLLPLRSESVLAELDVRLLRGTTVESIDRAARTVTIHGADGARNDLRYDHLVLATGGRARGAGADGGSLPGEDADGLHRLRTESDAARLAAALKTTRDVVVVGGGVIGLEFATLAAAAGARTTVLERGERILRRFVGPTTGTWLEARHDERGVRVLHETAVASFQVGDDGAVRGIVLGDGTELPAGLVLLGTGVEAATELAERAGLTTRGGIVVDATLRTEDPRISAIGDCALFPCHHAVGPRRVESVQNATDQARYLAAQLAGQGMREYRDVPWFWSVQAGVKIQVAGIAGADDVEVISGDPVAGKFSVLRFVGQRLTCVESIGRPADHLAARKLLASGAGPTLDDALAGRIENLKTWSAAVTA